MLERLFHAAGDDELTPPPPDADFWFQDPGPADATHDERRIRRNPDSALYISAFYACVRVIVETVAQLSLQTYKRLPNGGKEAATGISLYRVLHDAPNPNMDSFEFREMVTGHVLMRGDGLAEIKSDGRNVVAELIPIHPDKVEIQRFPNGRRRYKVDEGSAVDRRTILQEQMFHLRGPRVVEYAARALALAQAMELHGANLFANGANPGGVLSHPGVLSERAAKRLERRFNTERGGTAHTGETILLEEGMKWEQVGLNSVDSEWVAGQSFTVEQICRFFRMQPHMIQHLARSTNNNIETQGEEFVAFTMLPWLKRWEGAITRSLIIVPGLYFAEFNVDSLMRAKYTERLTGYNLGRNMGLYTPNDLRRMENMNPREDAAGNEFLSPLNMATTENPAGGAPAPPRGQPEPAPVPARTRPRAVPKRQAAALERAELLARDAAMRVLGREVGAVHKLAITHAADPEGWAAGVREFFGRHLEAVAEILHVTEDTARAYVAGQASTILEGGAGVLEQWTAINGDRVTALALTGESK